MSLAQPLLVRSQDERQVGEFRQGFSHRPIEKNLFRRIGNVIGSAYDMGDPHVHIVGNHHKMIGRNPVGPQENEILQNAVVDLYFPEYPVVKQRPAGGDSEAQREGLSRFGFPGRFFHGEAGARVVFRIFQVRV